MCRKLAYIFQAMLPTIVYFRGAGLVKDAERRRLRVKYRVQCTDQESCQAPNSSFPATPTTSPLTLLQQEVCVGNLSVPVQRQGKCIYISLKI